MPYFPLSLQNNIPWNKDYDRNKCTVLKEHTELLSKGWEMGGGEVEGWGKVFWSKEHLNRFK